jgi:fluoride ion exporter CrcB/FEX
MTTLLVGIGGTLGVLARYGLSRLTLHSEALLWSTVGINIGRLCAGPQTGLKPHV